MTSTDGLEAPSSACAYDSEFVPRVVRRQSASRRISVLVGWGDGIDVSWRSNPPTGFSAFVAGPDTSPATIAMQGHQRGVEIDLPSLRSSVLFGVPAGDLTGQVVGLETLVGSLRSAELTERLIGASRRGVDPLSGALEEWSQPTSANLAEPDRRVLWAHDQLRASNGSVRIEVLVDEIGWSHRHFLCRYREQIGLSPKASARLFRFEHAQRLLEQRTDTIAMIAATCGYSDHSHLDREFRSLAGCRPSEIGAHASDP